MTCRVVVAGTGYWAATLRLSKTAMEVDYLLVEMAISKNQGRLELSV
jgi:hypothetical protein